MHVVDRSREPGSNVAADSLGRGIDAKPLARR
jgi:hypothetical protein